MKRITALNVNGYESRQSNQYQPWKWIADAADDRLSWDFVSISDYPSLLRIRKPLISRYFTAWRAAWKAREADLIVTHGEKIAIWTGIFLRLLRQNPQFIAWGFHTSNYKHYGRIRKALVRIGLKHVDRFIVFSVIEKHLYSEGLGLPADRFEMIQWSVAKPEFDKNLPALHAGDYIAAIGGEGRDYATLFKAMKQLTDIKLVVVGTAKSLEGLESTENITALTDIPYEQAINIANHALFLILPLESREIPCGHGTLITQFNLGKATIISDSDAMTGYIVPGKNALTYPAGDSETLKQQIEKLYSDKSLRKNIAHSGEQFAKKYCSEEFTIDYFNAYVKEHFFNGEMTNSVDV